MKYLCLGCLSISILAQEMQQSPLSQLFNKAQQERQQYQKLRAEEVERVQASYIKFIKCVQDEYKKNPALGGSYSYKCSDGLTFSVVHANSTNSLSFERIKKELAEAAINHFIDNPEDVAQLFVNRLYQFVKTYINDQEKRAVVYRDLAVKLINNEFINTIDPEKINIYLKEVERYITLYNAHAHHMPGSLYGKYTYGVIDINELKKALFAELERRKK